MLNSSLGHLRHLQKLPEDLAQLVTLSMQQASECIVRFRGQDAGEAIKNLMPAAQVNRSISQGQVAGGLEEVLECRERGDEPSAAQLLACRGLQPQSTLHLQGRATHLRASLKFHDAGRTRSHTAKIAKLKYLVLIYN